jgi:outer membrane protein OmpA-like peptidoglycan-associated protein
MFVAAVLAATSLFAQRGAADAAAMEAEIHRTGSVVLYGISFDAGAASVQPGSERTLREIITLLKARTDWRFEVQGHTDAAGPAAANVTLSHQRAEAIVEWLTEHGVEASRLVGKGYGDTVPLADNTSDEGRARNRRVELKKLNDE